MADRLIDLLFTAHNRRAFTEASLGTLIENTNWELVDRAVLIDDDSTDGTWEIIASFAPEIPTDVTLLRQRLGGPVAAMNAYLDRGEAGQDVLAKIDNDVIVCPGWLDVMAHTLKANPNIDCLGMEPGFATVFDRWYPDFHTAKPARWIGGVGLIRTRIFERRRPRMNDRWFGWTQFQKRYAHCAWIDPDLPVFLLDKLNVEPWRSLTREYVERGWAREWPDDLNYDAETTERYAGWWLEQVAA